MQTSSDKNKTASAGPTATDHRPGGGAATAATELGRHYGEHGQPATASAGPPAHDSAPGSARQDASRIGEQAHSAMAKAGETAQDLANRAREQVAPAIAKVTETAQDLVHRAREQAAPAMAKAGETAQDLANRAREQVAPAIAKVTETAQDLAHRTREQAAPAAQVVYDQGARAGQYVTRNVHDYPATALLIAAAIGYSLAYLIHGGGRFLRWGRHEHRNRYSQGAH
jgi:ElaB/YqjD/DUF883 family membrane-anchored ribosome-binding protein